MGYGLKKTFDIFDSANFFRSSGFYRTKIGHFNQQLCTFQKWWYFENKGNLYGKQNLAFFKLAVSHFFNNFYTISL